ncbi:MAG: hypothetical protein AMDU1_APLC00019G0005, partial [Thermoplasmatales archaeon A-plasma]
MAQGRDHALRLNHKKTITEAGPTTHADTARA